MRSTTNTHPYPFCTQCSHSHTRFQTHTVNRYVWSSTQSALFRQLSPLIIAADSSFSLTVAPDSITTVSTVATASHGSFPDSPVPANLPWPLPYSDNFGNYSYDAMARYFADQAGSWAVRNGSLMQVGI